MISIQVLGWRSDPVVNDSQARRPDANIDLRLRNDDYNRYGCRDIDPDTHPGAASGVPGHIYDQKSDWKRDDMMRYSSGASTFCGAGLARRT